MPTTTNRPITPAQQRFVASLASERAADHLAGAVAQAATGALSSSAASTLIDALTAAPRRPRTRSGEDIARPDASVRAGRMLLAGGITATVTLPNGEHVTVEIGTRRRVSRGWGNCSPTDEGARTNIRVLGTKVGWLNVSEDGQWTATLYGRDHIKDAVRVLLGYAAGGDCPVDFRVQVADRCGRCRRQLTDPVSIERGIGPECYGRDTGSRHAAVGQPVDAAAPERTAEELEALEIVADGLMLPTSGAIGRAHEAAETARAERALIGDAPIDASLITLAARAQRRRSRHAKPDFGANPSVDPRVQRARDLIAEALDASCTDEDRDYAMGIFDQLANR